MDSFELHPRLAADTHPVGNLPLCRLLMMDDANYPWFILVPRVTDVVEVHDLDDETRHRLWDESALLGRALIAAFGGDKLNVAALGNVVPQLHVHHVVRRRGDPAWPAPVWGRVPARSHTPQQCRQSLQLLRAALAAQGVHVAQ